MHLRTSTVRRKGKTHRYTQLVESYRRPGYPFPLTRVIAHLGERSPQEVANLKAALAASRRGQAVVTPSESLPADAASGVVLDNLLYLPVAVILALWSEIHLDCVVNELMPSSGKDVPAASMVAALTVQRCVAPGSKLYAQRWFPRTALPELLGVTPAQFNNVRVHRTLEDLDRIAPDLQKRLPTRCASSKGQFSALFLDVTDTWFVGQGPEMAEPNKTKEGRYERRVGIVLLCDQHGLPLRWEVIPGRQHDSQAMASMLHAVAGLPWVADTPVVFDRAMGKTAHLREVLKTGVRFLTALTVDEYAAYTDRIPHEAMAGINAFADGACAEAASAAVAAGMTQLSDDLLVLDLGVVTRTEAAELPRSVTTVPGSDPVQRALEQARQMRVALDTGSACGLREAGRLFGFEKSYAARLLRLLQLPDDLLADIAAGGAAHLSVTEVTRIAALPDPQAQRVAYDQARSARQGQVARRRRGSPAPEKQRQREARADEDSMRMRAVLCFNPQQFAHQRRQADETLAEIQTRVRDLNDQLSSPRARRTRESAYAYVEQELRRRDLLDAFDIVLGAHAENGRPTVTVTLRPEAWQRRRRHDGFNLLVAHPESLQDAAALALLYRAKDAIEKDFHVIKSVVELRPVRHRTDAKVRAHVTLCMLALLLQRALERKLAARLSCAMSAERALELLANVHLNRLQTSGSDVPLYTVTRTSADQDAILDALDLAGLVDDHEVANRISPR